jgi:penicillin-binding protein 1A
MIKDFKKPKYIPSNKKKIRKNVKKQDTSKDNKNAKKKDESVSGKRKAISLLLRIFLILIFIIALAGGLTLGGAYYYYSRDLPGISRLEEYRPPVVTSLYSADNQKIAEFYKERRFVIPLSQMPDNLINAFVAAEDARFFQHEGVDFKSIVRAFFKNMEAGKIVQGASTITMQVTRSFFLTREKSYERKIREAILAYRIDRRFSKEDILYLYLNQIYLGQGAYGVEAAARSYFGKTAGELNLAECAMLAGLPQAPSDYSPFHNFQEARERQVYVLQRMAIAGFIDDVEAADAVSRELEFPPRKNWYLEQTPYYSEYVRQYVEKKYGRDMLYTGGLKIYAAVDVQMQNIAKKQMDIGLRELDKRQGYRGPLRRIPPEKIESYLESSIDENGEKPLEKQQIVEAVVVSVDNSEKQTIVRFGDSRGILPLKHMKWARKPNPKVFPRYHRVKRPGDVLKTGDVVLVRLMEKLKDPKAWEVALEQEPEVQSALICLKKGTGRVLAMVGGRNFEKSQFNRAIQSRRQPGSSFKPIIYAAAVDKGYTPATMIIDNAVVYRDTLRNAKWKPKNYSHKFYGPIMLRTALTKSRNLATIRIVQDIGIDYVIEYARNLGIKSPLSKNLSLALGSSGVSLLELVQAYSVFANGGMLYEPVFISRIEDRDGNILEKASPENKRVIQENTAYIMTSLLESVVNEGTGRRVKKIGRPAAGKTGTTNDMYDAWFVGYTPEYITGVWVGFDEERTLGRNETGSRAASPIWLDFMSEIHKDEPVRAFQVPDGVVFAQIDTETGLLPIPQTKKTRFECFKEGTVPEKHSQPASKAGGKEDLFKSDL